jgi:hypothetical protein
VSYEKKHAKSRLDYQKYILRIIFYMSTKNLYDPIGWWNLLLCKGIYIIFIMNTSFSCHFKYFKNLLNSKNIGYFILRVFWVLIHLINLKLNQTFMHNILKTFCESITNISRLTSWFTISKCEKLHNDCTFCKPLCYDYTPQLFNTLVKRPICVFELQLKVHQ